MSRTDHPTAARHRSPPDPDRAGAPPARCAPAPGQQDDPARHVAHEMANLLDGSLRNLGLAIGRLRAQAPSGATPRGEAVLPQLLAASGAMTQMAQLVRGLLEQRGADPDAPGTPLAGFDPHQTLGQTVEQVLSLYSPAARELGVSLTASVALDAAALPAGPVGTVLHNALGNALESIAAADRPAWPETARPGIELSLSLEAGSVRLVVADTGGGIDPRLFDDAGRLRTGVTTKPHGHGLGLPACVRIAEDLGGELRLAHRRPHGAVLTLTYPAPDRAHDHG